MDVATDDLVLQMRLPIRSWLRRHQSNRSDLDDLEQAAMVAVIAAAKRYDGRVLWPTFAWPRAIGAVYDEIRRSRPRGYRRPGQFKPGEQIPYTWSLDTPIDGDGLTIGDTIEAQPEPGDIFESDEVRSVVEALPVNLRTAVELVYFEDMQVCDVAHLLDVCDNRVYQTLGEALELLRIAITEMNPR